MARLEREKRYLRQKGWSFEKKVRFLKLVTASTLISSLTLGPVFYYLSPKTSENAKQNKTEVTAFVNSNGCTKEYSSGKSENSLQIKSNQRELEFAQIHRDAKKELFECADRLAKRGAEVKKIDYLTLSINGKNFNIMDPFSYQLANTWVELERRKQEEMIDGMKQKEYDFFQKEIEWFNQNEKFKVTTDFKNYGYYSPEITIMTLKTLRGFLDRGLPLPDEIKYAFIDEKSSKGWLVIGMFSSPNRQGETTITISNLAQVDTFPHEMGHLIAHKSGKFSQEKYDSQFSDVTKISKIKKLRDTFPDQYSFDSFLESKNDKQSDFTEDFAVTFAKVTVDKFSKTKGFKKEIEDLKKIDTEAAKVLEKKYKFMSSVWDGEKNICD